MRDLPMIEAELELARRDLAHRLAAVRARLTATVDTGRKVKDAIVPTLAAIAGLGVITAVLLVLRARRHRRLLLTSS